MKVRNPRTGVTDYEIHALSPGDVDQVVRRMRDAEPTWAARSVEERAGFLRKLADSIGAHGDAIMAALIEDTGRARISRIEVEGVIRLIERWANTAPAIIHSATRNGQATGIPNITTSTRLAAYPLVGVISPWNFPLTLALIDVVPALMAGCAVIVKPSEITPRFIKPLLEAIRKIPEIPLAIIEGDGVTGAALVPLVDYIAFTGSVATGRKIAAIAANEFIPASLELGGKDPLVVLASADPVKAADIALRASVLNAGQACQSIERVYVAREIAEPFLAALVEKAMAVRPNYPDINSGDIGPFISAAQAGIVQEQIDDAVANGAQVRSGGTVENLGGGLYLRPTVLVDVTCTMKVMTDETFGPVIPVTTFETVEQAIALANDSSFGLSASVVAGTLDEAEAVGGRLNVGAVSLNDGSLTSMVWEAEKSSFGRSGLGPSRMGESGILRFFRKQALIRQSGTALPLSAYSEGVTE